MKTGIVPRLTVILLAVAGLVVSSGCPLTAPGDGSDGDDVGTLRAETQIQILDFVGEFETFTLQGSFFDADSDELENLGLAGSGFFGMEIQTQEIGGCTVGTQNFTLSSDDEFNQTPDRDFGGLSAIDPGEPGIASVGTASVNLLRGTFPNFGDLPAPILAGVFSPSESSDELIALGFGGSQTINFSFPGGADVDPFSISLDMPDKITVTTPDLSAGSLTLDTSRDWDILWIAGNLADTMRVVLTRINSDSVSNPDGSFSTTGNVTAISCEFADDGTGTIPAGALALLPAKNASSATAIVFFRERTVFVTVPLRRVAGDGVVRAVGSAIVARSFTEFDTSDLCALITCPEGEVCNPETFQCDQE